ISAFNFALVGVLLAYVFRYMADTRFASLGPMIRRTRLDRNLFAFGLLVILSCLRSFNLNTDPHVVVATAVSLKEHVLYFVWFYMVVTLLRTPKDLRRFAMFFAIAGLIVSFFGMATRLMGGAGGITAGTVEPTAAEGAGGRMQGGWLGLGHPNMFAALLLMTVPIWFFAVSHLKHGIRRIVAEVAVINGFLGLLFTYSRSAWIGSMLGVGLVGLADKKSLQRIILFGFIFAIAAQIIVLFTIDTNLADVVINRFAQLGTSTFSARPYVYASAIQVIRDYPLMGVGLGAFQAHAPALPMGWVPSHAHNVYLGYAAEAGIPVAFFFVIFVIRILWTSVRNLRVVGRLPGYGFIALGSCAAFLGLIVQSMAVLIFRQPILGFGFYALAAIVVALDRMIKEGQFHELEGVEPGARSTRDPWIGS
ncbi:MAG: O-antigen ligase family protein, partial [Candidatus Eisenbacteria sp.]|nr:O-antigen ligase family protein [Candidatus Eisenbacteria bacterium]